MQLNKLIAFHKTVGDATRIRILSLLAGGPKNGQALAGILSLSAPTISHHLSKLKDINAVRERREKNTIYYHLNKDVLLHYSGALPKLILEGTNERNDTDMELAHRKILDNFLTAEGKIKTIPSQRKKKLIVLHHIASGLKMGKIYEEKEINEYIKKYHEDFATIRREFIMSDIMHREQNRYELNPREMWELIE